MSWIKRNLFFVIGSVVALALMGLAGWFLYTKWNLNNQIFGFYQGSSQYMIQREYYQPTIAAGFRWSPVREK